MDLRDVYNVVLAVIITSALIAFPLAVITTIRLRAALPQHRPSNKANHNGKKVEPSIASTTSESTSSSLSEPEKTSTLKSRVLSSAPPTNSKSLSTSCHKCTTTIFLGSGGHTAEMLQLVSGLDTSKYSPRHYVVGWDDESSVEKLHRLEASRNQKDVTSAFQEYSRAKNTANQDADSLDGYTVHRIPRSRHVHQSMITTPFTLAKSLLVAMPLIKRLTCLSKQDVSPISDSQSLSSTTMTASSTGSSRDKACKRKSIMLMNGPGTCFALALAVIGARMLGVPDEQTPDLIFIESFARVKTLSLAGKLLYHLCDVFLVQWPDLRGRYPRAQYIGTLV
ncbi:UDP-N-acetylglucosamine transferase subunit [Mortierella sp. AD011]|nr:UDP-N-acetylglucosamine transferase subunit [Mortierella sp. AD010]KAF9399652.1 UDP-N-acetylglucosamine transferase subunit [Mortierella sp. AD011]